MSSLVSEILERFQPGLASVEAPWLRELLQRAMSGEGKVMRLSARRLVLHLPASPKDGQDYSSPEGFLVKLDAPQRRMEGLRRILRTPPAKREARAWRKLDRAGKRGDWAGLPFPIEQVGRAQFDAARGCFSRPFVRGCPGSAFTVRDLAAAGLGLARLHESGWTDPDLSPGDLLLDSRSVLLPLDLGHARIDDAPTTTDDRRRDLIQILGGWSVPQRQTLAQGFLAAYEQAASLPDTSERLIDLAILWRQQILQRQAHRCLRRTSDFEVTAQGMMRTAGVVRDPSVVMELASEAVARRLWRHLYELELHGLPTLQVVQLEGKTITASLPDQGVAEREMLQKDLRRSGFLPTTEASRELIQDLSPKGFYLHATAPLQRRDP